MIKIIKNWRNWAFLLFTVLLVFALQSELFPPPPLGDDIMIINSYIEEDWLHLHLTGTQTQACTRIAFSEQGYYKISYGDPLWLPTDFKISHSPAEKIILNKPKQNFGIWGWNITSAAQVLVIMQHICEDDGYFNIVHTTIGPFDVAHLTRSEQ